MRQRQLPVLRNTHELIIARAEAHAQPIERGTQHHPQPNRINPPKKPPTKWPAKATTTRAHRNRNTLSNPTGKLLQRPTPICRNHTSQLTLTPPQPTPHISTNTLTPALPQANTSNSPATAHPRPSSMATSSLPWATNSRLRSSPRPKRRRTADA
jgi:hypothetical protein